MKEEAFYTRNGWKNIERKSKAQYAFSNSHFQSIFRSPLTMLQNDIRLYTGFDSHFQQMGFLNALDNMQPSL